MALMFESHRGSSEAVLLLLLLTHDVAHGGDRKNLPVAPRENKTFIKMLNTSPNAFPSLWTVTKLITVWRIGQMRHLAKKNTKKRIAGFLMRNC